MRHVGEIEEKIPQMNSFSYKIIIVFEGNTRGGFKAVLMRGTI